MSNKFCGSLRAYYFCPKSALLNQYNLFSMKKLIISALVLGALLGFSLDLAAQSRNKKKKSKKEEFSIRDRLWYGLGPQFGFQPFSLGLSPMVGFKVIERISIGPKASLLWIPYKLQGFRTLNLLDTELGGFVRVRAFRGLFLQGEIAQAWTQFPDNPTPANPTELTRRVVSQSNPVIGLGWNFSNGEGGFSQEIGIYYNFRIANDLNSIQPPVSYRFAFTLGF
jgi:hypothetical protein